MLELIVPPVAEPVSLSDAKLHLRVDHAHEDALIMRVIKTAREYCEQYQRVSYLEQTWRLWLESWPDVITLARMPVNSITSIRYVTSDHVEHTLSPAVYFLDASGGRVLLNTGKAWPTADLRKGNAISVDFVCGMTTVPEAVKSAMLLLVGLWYENREAMTERKLLNLDFAVRSLLGFDRVRKW